MSTVWAARVRWPPYMRCFSDRFSFADACNHKMKISILFHGFSDPRHLAVKQFLQGVQETAADFFKCLK